MKRVTISDLGDLGDLLGGIGVIATLAYLALQIRRNTQAMQSASLDAVAGSHLEFQRAIWSDPELTRIWFDGRSRVALEEKDGRRFIFMVMSLARLWERAYNNQRGGTLGSTAWSGIHHELVLVFRSEGTWDYWQRIQDQFPTDFVEFVDRAVHGAP